MGETYLSEPCARAVWTILVEHVGARAEDAEQFVDHATNVGLTEYRFQGSLAFGGKLWACRASHGFARGERLFVNCYPEDRTPERDTAIDAANRALAALDATR